MRGVGEEGRGGGDARRCAVSGLAPRLTSAPRGSAPPPSSPALPRAPHRVALVDERLLRRAGPLERLLGHLLDLLKGAHDELDVWGGEWGRQQVDAGSSTPQQPEPEPAEEDSLTRDRVAGLGRRRAALEHEHAAELGLPLVEGGRERVDALVLGEEVQDLALGALDGGLQVHRHLQQQRRERHTRGCRHRQPQAVQASASALTLFAPRSISRLSSPVFQ